MNQQEDLAVQSINEASNRIVQGEVWVLGTLAHLGYHKRLNINYFKERLVHFNGTVVIAYYNLKFIYLC